MNGSSLQSQFPKEKRAVRERGWRREGWERGFKKVGYLGKNRRLTPQSYPTKGNEGQ